MNGFAYQANDRWPVILITVALTAGAVLFSVSGDLPWLGLGPFAALLWIGLRDLRTLFALLLFTLPLSAEIMVTESLGTDFPDEGLMWMFSVLSMLAAIVYRKRIPEKKMDPLLAAVLFMHLAWILICCVQSPQPWLSFKFLAAKLWYLLAFCFSAWYFTRSVRDLRRAAWLLLIPLCAAALVVLFRHQLSGFGFDSVNAAVRPLFRNHVNYGAMLVCLLPLAVLIWVQQPGRRKIIAPMILLILLALLFSYSRGAWVGLGIAIAAALALRYNMLKAMFVMGIVLLGVLLVWFSHGNRYLSYRPDFDRTIYHQDFRKHLEATYRLRDLSTAERFHRWIAGVRMVADRPWLGHGPNRFYPAYKPYTVQAFRTYVSDNPEHSTVHNYFLLLAVEQGLPGMVLFLILTWLMVHRVSLAYQRSGTDAERQVWMAVAAVVTVIVWLNMLSDLVETDKIGSLFLMCLGVLLGNEGGNGTTDKGYPKLSA